MRNEKRARLKTMHLNTDGEERTTRVEEIMVVEEHREDHVQTNSNLSSTSVEH